jgi:hypothetical protein
MQVDRRRPLALSEGRHQGRAESVVEHRRQKAALDVTGGVEELLAGGEGDLDRLRFGIDRHQLPAEQDRGGRWRDAALQHVPERAAAVGH